MDCQHTGAAVRIRICRARDLDVINPKMRYIFLHDLSFAKHKQATVSQLPTADYSGLDAELLVIEIIVTEIGVVVLYSAAVCLERLRVEVSEPRTVNLHFRFHAECLFTHQYVYLNVGSALVATADSDKRIIQVVAEIDRLVGRRWYIKGENGLSVKIKELCGGENRHVELRDGTQGAYDVLFHLLGLFNARYLVC